jgi:dienelactone hydrolase
MYIDDIIKGNRKMIMRSTTPMAIFVIAWIILWAGSPGRAQQKVKSQAEDLPGRAERSVQLLSQDDFAAVAASFDSVLLQALPAERLREVWQNLTTQVGAFEKILLVRTEKRQEYQIIYVTCEFSRTVIDVKFVFNDKKQVTGLWFVPSPSSPSAAYQPPDYVKVNAFTEEEMQIGTKPWILPGTLTVPAGEGSFWAVVLVHGSGPHDRDETIGVNKPFRDLAWGLASQGIAVLRYEKRTKVYPDEIASLMERFTVKQETIDDALSAVHLLRQEPKINPDKIFVLGHSLGGMLAPRIAQADPNIAGLIILAGTTRRLEDVYFAQMSYLFSLDGDISREESEQLKKIKQQIDRVKKPDSLASFSADQLPLDLPGAYWIDLDKFKAPELARQLHRPMLIMQGGRDYQVTLDDFRGWKKVLEGQDKVNFKLFLKLNHLFMPGTGTSKSTPAEYEIADHVAEDVVQTIADWIKKN